jgi:hypothetical protein
VCRDLRRLREDIDYNAVGKGCASGFGKKVIRRNGEVRIRGDVGRHDILFYAMSIELC